MVGPANQSAGVVSVWIVRTGANVPRFVTVIRKRTMRYRTLDVVVLDRELPDRSLRKGDLGAVVDVYEPDGLEVEFITAAGRTEAPLTLGVTDVRPVADHDLVAVRPYRRST